jgi:hypothetical protein
LRLIIWKQNDRCCREKEKNIVKLKLWMLFNNIR